MSNMNKVIILGRLGADPEIKQGQDDSMFGTLSVGTNRKIKDKDGNYNDETTWTKVAVYGQSAKFAYEYLRKGAPVLVEGRLRNRSYENKDGQTVHVTEVAASNLQGLGKSEDK